MNSSMMILLRLTSKKIYNVPCQINQSGRAFFSVQLSISIPHIS